MYFLYHKFKQMTRNHCFWIYDIALDKFIIEVSQGIQHQEALKDAKELVQSNLNRQEQSTQEQFNIETQVGVFYAKLDKQGGCFHLLYTSCQENEAAVRQLLEQLFTLILSSENYQKRAQPELQAEVSTNIPKLMDEFGNGKTQEENKIFSEQGKKPSKQHELFQAQLQDGNSAVRPAGQKGTIIGSRSVIGSQIDLNRSGQDSHVIPLTEDFLKVFRCFMMFDFNRQFFFLFIRKGFDIDKTWSKERQQLQEKLLEQIKKPPEMFIYDGSFGQYRCKYDTKNKCYFILLSRFHSKTEKSDELLQQIYEVIQKVPKYIQIRHDELDRKKRSELEKLIDKHESDYAKQFGEEFMNVKQLEKALKKVIQKEQSNSEANVSFSRVKSIKGTIVNEPFLDQISPIEMKQKSRKEEGTHKLDTIREQENNFNDYYQPGEVQQKIILYQTKRFSIANQLTAQNSDG